MPAFLACTLALTLSRRQSCLARLSASCRGLSRLLARFPSFPRDSSAASLASRVPPPVCSLVLSLLAKQPERDDDPSLLPLLTFPPLSERPCHHATAHPRHPITTLVLRQTLAGDRRPVKDRLPSVSLAPSPQLCERSPFRCHLCRKSRRQQNRSCQQPPGNKRDQRLKTFGILIERIPERKN